MVYDKHVIANELKSIFFPNMGPTLVSQINNTGKQTYKGYLKNQNSYAFDFTPIDEA